MEQTLIGAADLQQKQISEIAYLIRKDWKANAKNGINYAAKPYLDAMDDLASINDKYFYDSGREIVMYFLANAQSYRGEQAKLIKAELNRRLKERG